MTLEITQTLDLLNFYLKKKALSRSFIICGGAALILQGITREGRVTQDVDVLIPEIDQALKEISIQVADELGLSPKWLNTDAKNLVKDLEMGWESRIFKVYKNSNLEVFSISRTDMIFAKFWAFCDRQIDINDLIDLKVTKKEIEMAENQTKDKDGSPFWAKHVEEQSQKLKVRMNYE